MKKLSLQGWRARPKSTVAIYPSVYTVAYATGWACRKAYGAKLNSVIYALGQDDFEIFMEPKSDYLKFSALLVKKFKQQPQYLAGLIKWSEGRVDLLFDLINKNFGQDIGQLSNQEIARRYQKYVDGYLAYHFKNTPAWWIGAIAAEEELKKYLADHYPEKEVNSLLSTIIAPLEYPSENFKEELSLLEIAIKLKKNNQQDFYSLNSLSKSERASFNKHVASFSSLSFGYKTGLVWTSDYFLKRLREIIKQKPAELRLAKLNEIKTKIIKRDKLMFSLRLPLEIKNLVIALRKLAYLQELKKTTQTKSHPLLELTVKPEIARRLQINVRYLEFLSETEITRLLMAGRMSAKFKKELIQRESWSVNVIKNTKSNWLIGSAAKKFIKDNDLLLSSSDVKELKGQSACRGLARGRVKICLLSTEINKIKKGDILVTAMTTPDFVPAMRRAAAIVTDEGGITSHAAIVARELNKPCVIGAKNASKILHDGDLIEIDANQGIIRKLSKY